MKFNFSPQFYKDLAKLKKENSKLGFKVFELIKSIDSSENPLAGVGKPEALKGNLTGIYSRRITDKHRLLYEYKENSVYILSCYGHYGDT